MLVAAIELRAPITAHCASQSLDLSMRQIQLTEKDWDVLVDLEQLFKIFVKPTRQMQASNYPALSAVILWYMRMINKLKAVMSG